MAGGRRRRHPAGRRDRGGLQGQLAEAEDPVAAAGRDQRPHRERPRPDRAAQQVPDRGADRPPRHLPLHLRVGRAGVQGGRPRRPGSSRDPCSSGP